MCIYPSAFSVTFPWSVCRCRYQSVALCFNCYNTIWLLTSLRSFPSAATAFLFLLFFHCKFDIDLLTSTKILVVVLIRISFSIFIKLVRIDVFMVLSFPDQVHIS